MGRTVIRIKDGQVKLETFGFAGEACEAATKRAEVALGRRVANERKSEYYEAAGEGVSEEVR